jgi:hypothetical protein
MSCNHIHSFETILQIKEFKKSFHPKIIRSEIVSCVLCIDEQTEISFPLPYLHHWIHSVNNSEMFRSYFQLIRGIILWHFINPTQDKKVIVGTMGLIIVRSWKEGNFIQLQWTSSVTWKFEALSILTGIDLTCFVASNSIHIDFIFKTFEVGSSLSGLQSIECWVVTVTP